MAGAGSREAYGPWWKRLGWLALIWMLGVGALAVVVLVLRLVMQLAGLST